MTKPLKTALIYDFDGTLARGNMQEVTFIPPHTTLPDLPHTLNTITQHFTSRFLTGLHTILHISVNEIYAQLAHSYRTLNTRLPPAFLTRFN